MRLVLAVASAFGAAGLVDDLVHHAGQPEVAAFFMILFGLLAILPEEKKK